MSIKLTAIKSWNVFAAIWNVTINLAICAGIIAGLYFFLDESVRWFVEQNVWAIIKTELNGGIRLIHAVFILLISGLVYWAVR